MCGISGWVGYGRDFERDQEPQREIARAMAETMSCRGPDAGGLWLGPHAALGHRRLAVIDLAGGVQPMRVSEDGRTLAVITYSGEVYNYRELRQELTSRGHRFHTDSDTEVVLRAYLEWGEDLVDRLNGMYAFAVWDTRTEELLLVRDRMGIKPLYYHPTPDGVLFGSEPKAILANPMVSPVVDLDGLRELLSFAKTPEHAVYRGMAEVRPGQVVRVARGGLTRRRYWRLEAVEHTDDLAATVGTVRELLEDIVTRQLISDVPLCSLLSGGLDSSVITALAARALRAADAGPVRSFAVDFAGYTENFQADPMRDAPDAPFVHELAEHVAAAHTDIVVSTAELMAPAARAAVIRAADLPNSLGDMYTSLYLLFAAIREHSTVALSGESADEVFGGYPWFHNPAMVGADTFPWVSMLRAAGFDETGLLHPDLRTQLDLSGYRDASYQTALAEVPHLDGVDSLERRMREVCYLHLTRFVQVLLDRKDRMSMASGLEVRVPFCDHRLVQYVFNTPWSMKAFDGREKSLLRAATRDILPASIAARLKSPYPSTQDRGYEVALREELARLFARKDSPVAPLLDADRVRDLLAEPMSGSSTIWTRGHIEMLLGLDAWLSGYGVSLRLDR